MDVHQQQHDPSSPADTPPPFSLGDPSLTTRSRGDTRADGTSLWMPPPSDHGSDDNPLPEEPTITDPHYYLPRDARSGLPIIAPPPGLRRRFTPNSVLHFFTPVTKINHRNATERRMLLLSDECLYLAKPAENLTRCMEYRELTAIYVPRDNQTHVALHSGGGKSYDMLLQLHSASPDHRDDLVNVVARLHQVSNKGHALEVKREYTWREIGTALRETRKKPNGYNLKDHLKEPTQLKNLGARYIPAPAVTAAQGGRMPPTRDPYSPHNNIVDVDEDELHAARELERENQELKSKLWSDPEEEDFTKARERNEALEREVEVLVSQLDSPIPDRNDVPPQTEAPPDLDAEFRHLQGELHNAQTQREAEAAERDALCGRIREELVAAGDVPSQTEDDPHVLLKRLLAVRDHQEKGRMVDQQEAEAELKVRLRAAQAQVRDLSVENGSLAANITSLKESRDSLLSATRMLNAELVTLPPSSSQGSVSLQHWEELSSQHLETERENEMLRMQIMAHEEQRQRHEHDTQMLQRALEESTTGSDARVVQLQEDLQASHSELIGHANRIADHRRELNDMYEQKYRLEMEVQESQYKKQKAERQAREMAEGIGQLLRPSTVGRETPPAEWEEQDVLPLISRHLLVEEWLLHRERIEGEEAHCARQIVMSWANDLARMPSPAPIQAPWPALPPLNVYERGGSAPPTPPTPSQSTLQSFRVAPPTLDRACQCEELPMETQYQHLVDQCMKTFQDHVTRWQQTQGQRMEEAEATHKQAREENKWLWADNRRLTEAVLAAKVPTEPTPPPSLAPAVAPPPQMHPDLATALAAHEREQEQLVDSLRARIQELEQAAATQSPHAQWHPPPFPPPSPAHTTSDENLRGPTPRAGTARSPSFSPRWEGYGRAPPPQAFEGFVPYSIPHRARSPPRRL